MSAGAGYPRWHRGDGRANLREVGEDIFVGGAIAVLERPARGRRWWGAVDAHGPRHAEALRRELAFGEVERSVRWGFEDGDAVPAGLLDAAVALARARRGPLLVCCAMGVSRSASIAYAVLRAVSGLGHDEALRRVACEAGRPLVATLASAKAWAEAHAGPVCGACGGSGRAVGLLITGGPPGRGGGPPSL